MPPRVDPDRRVIESSTPLRGVSENLIHRTASGATDLHRTRYAVIALLGRVGVVRVIKNAGQQITESIEFEDELISKARGNDEAALFY